jgi:hypothetical protein
MLSGSASAAVRERRAVTSEAVGSQLRKRATGHRITESKRAESASVK